MKKKLRRWANPDSFGKAAVKMYVAVVVRM